LGDISPFLCPRRERIRDGESEGRDLDSFNFENEKFIGLENSILYNKYSSKQ
jgi:hypothetical protein